jgi:signal transduction histidine kinase
LGVASSSEGEQVLAALMHELSAPVTAIEGFAELIDRPAAALDDEDFRPAIEAIRRNAAQLRQLLNCFADARRIDAGVLELRLVRTDLAALVEETVEELANAVAPRPLSAAITSPAPARVDAARVRQALTHLVHNAAKFSPTDAPVEVELTVDGTWAEVAVTDSGAGISEDQRHLLFGRFVQLQRGPGAGLGLYIAQGIAQAHGGEVVLASSTPSGSRFVLRLPVGSSVDDG